MGEIEIFLSCDLPPRRLDGLTRDLARELDRAGARARECEQATETGERGLAITLGKLAVDLVSSRIAAAALDVVKAYIVREKSLRLAITKPDGTKIEVDAKNVGSAYVAEFLGAAKSIL